MPERKVNESIIVAVDFTNGIDNGVLVVGRQKNGEITVINAIQGQEAYDLYIRLVEQKKALN